MLCVFLCVCVSQQQMEKYKESISVSLGEDRNIFLYFLLSICSFEILLVAVLVFLEILYSEFY